jgi:small subunit ribosomal protein S20
MANTTSAKKMVRKIAKRTAVNKSRKTRMRSTLRTVEEALSAGDKKKAEAALRSAEPQLMKAAQKGVIHRKTASRKISRLNKRLHTLAAK